MSDVAESVRVIAGWPEVSEAIAQASQACTRLRWHEALRRRIPEAAAESRVRGAHASAELDGARSDVRQVRELVSGVVAWPREPDPALVVVRAALRVTMEAEHVGAQITRAPAQALARLHLAGAAGLLPAGAIGRPRLPGEMCSEFTGLGSAPTDVTDRLAGIEALCRVGDAPALVVAALVHAEIVHVRPFVRINGLVARAVERVLVRARGLDPTGVAVPEAGHLRLGSTAYLGALGAYATGTRDGVALWVRQCADALVVAASEGQRICDGIRVGRPLDDAATTDPAAGPAG